MAQHARPQMRQTRRQAHTSAHKRSRAHRHCRAHRAEDSTCSWTAHSACFSARPSAALLPQCVRVSSLCGSVGRAAGQRQGLNDGRVLSAEMMGRVFNQPRGLDLRRESWRWRELEVARERCRPPAPRAHARNTGAATAAALTVVHRPWRGAEGQDIIQGGAGV